MIDGESVVLLVAARDVLRPYLALFHDHCCRPVPLPPRVVDHESYEMWFDMWGPIQLDISMSLILIATHFLVASKKERKTICGAHHFHITGHQSRIMSISVAETEVNGWLSESCPESLTRRLNLQDSRTIWWSRNLPELDILDVQYTRFQQRTNWVKVTEFID